MCFVESPFYKRSLASSSSLRLPRLVAFGNGSIRLTPLFQMGAKNVFFFVCVVLLRVTSALVMVCAVYNIRAVIPIY